MNPLSAWRYRWGPTELTPEYPRDDYMGPISAMVVAARDVSVARDGTVFREYRIRLQLGLQEVADGWGVSAVEVGELERGKRRFAETDDLKAALDQLWLWHMERRREGAVSSRGGTWDGREEG